MSPFFLPVEPGSRFCIYHQAVDGAGPRPGVVYVHPFCEEMNKTRRMAALQCRRLAAAGFSVLQVDLLGCGDSSGEFVEARWRAWEDDVRAAIEWLRGRSGGPLHLWGLRLGATLAAKVACDAGAGIDRLLLWQPVASGEQFLTQFLRLYLAAEMLSAGAAQTGLGELRARLAQGKPLEIAGYELHPELAAAVESVKLGGLVPAVSAVDWLEVSAGPEPRLAPASQRVIEGWRARGLEVRAAAVTGEPFWSTLEITECAPLLEATDRAMSGNSR